MTDEVVRYDIAVCAYVDATRSNQVTALCDWVQWNVGQYVNHIYIYISVPTKQIKDILKDYLQQRIVEIIPWNGSFVEACQDCIQHHVHDVVWLVLLDVQFFLAPAPKNITLTEILRLTEEQRPQLAAICLQETAVSIVRPSAIQELSEIGHPVASEGYEVEEDDGTYFLLLSEEEAMARLAPQAHHVAPFRSPIHQKMLEIYRRDAECKRIDTREIMQEMEPLFRMYGYREHTPGEPLRILLIHDTGVGDFINCSPAIREVRKAYPHAYITLVVFSRSRDMAATCPYVDQILVDPRRCNWSDPFDLFRWHIGFAQQLLPMHFDVCFNFISYGSSVLLSYLCGAAHRVGYASGSFKSDGPFPYETVAVFLTERIPFEMRGTHDVYYYLTLIERMTGRETGDCHPEVWTLSQETRWWQSALRQRGGNADWVAVVMGGTDERRHWPVELYGDLLGRIAKEETNLLFLILGGPGDRAAGDRLTEVLPDERTWNLAGRMDYRESTAALGCCVGYIGNDTGTLHAAAAQHLPVLTPNCYPADLPMPAEAIPRKFYPFGVPAVMVLPGHALPGCIRSADPWGCAQVQQAHCIRQISVPLMMAGYHLLKKMVREGREQTVFLFEKEDAVHHKNVIVAHAMEQLPRPEARARLDPAWRPKRIALASHVLARNGAPLALLAAAKCLQKHGYELHVYSVCAGPMQQDFEALGIPVTVQEDLLHHAWTDLPWYTSYDMILANTALFASCFHKPLGNVPVLWWLHEGASSLRWIGLTEENMKRMLVPSLNATTIGVSEIANRAFHALAPEWRLDGTLTLGMQDFCGRRERKEKSLNAPVIFLTIGAVEPRKGQDALCRAVELLTPAERGRCEFRLIGAWPAAAKEQTWRAGIEKEAAKHPEIKILGSLPHADVLKMYAKADAVIVPSQEETLSMVAIEGMAAGVPCILSDGVGVVHFAEPGESVLVFSAGDATGLAEQIRFVIHHQQEADEIGQAGRDVYETSFQPGHFEESLLRLVDTSMHRGSNVAMMYPIK